MALVLLCGYPASGKSTAATHLQATLQSHGHDSTIICDGDDQIHHAPHHSTPPLPPRALLYRDSATEKQTRARLRGAIERSLNGSRIVIVDSLNYIKGFRYEMFCIAKTTASKYCVAYCEQDAAECAQRDAKRAEEGEDGYGEALCAALIARFEEPMERCKWDSPLFRIDVFQEGWTKRIDALRDFVTGSGNKLVPSMATRLPSKVGANALGLVDRVTRQVESEVVEAIQGGARVGDKITVSQTTKVVRLERKPKVTEVRAVRRSYLNLVRMQPTQPSSEPALKEEYVDYLNARLSVKR